MKEPSHNPEPLLITLVVLVSIACLGLILLLPSASLTVGLVYGGF